ncbi:hypothetical protein PO909_004472 [Leuciscus waleckii]
MLNMTTAEGIIIKVKTTIKTEVRRAHASKARPTISGRTPNISSKVDLRRRLRSDSRKDRKRLVKNSCCALCGDVKYTPPTRKNLARLLNHRSRAGRPSPTAWQKGACHNSESRRPPTTPIFRFEKNPMVKLCDVARVFDIASRDFSCVLPAVLRQKRKCKRVRCLMKEFSFLVQPHLHGIRKQRSKIANQSWEVSTPTHSCASFSSGDPPSGATGSTYISDTAETPDGSVKEWDACLVRNPDCERMRQTDIEGTASVLPRCEDNGPVVRFCEKDEACQMNNISENPSSPVRRVPPLILRRVTVNGFGFRHDIENRGLSLEEEEEDRRNEDSDCEVNSPESFSCQRTQAYIFFPQSSCARTCKIWPFPRMGPPNEIRPSHLTGPRWIVTTSFPATVQTSHGVAPECLSDKDVQNKLSKPTKQSKSSDDAREVLEGQLLSSAPVTTSSSVDQEIKSVTPNSVVHTPDSNPDCSGEGKRTQVFDSYTITDSSSEDENKNFASLSSDEESVEHHAAESLLSDDDGTCQIKEKEQGSTPPPSPVVADSFLDVSRAYEEDVLILDVIQDDPELFGAVVTETKVTYILFLTYSKGDTELHSSACQVYEYFKVRGVEVTAKETSAVRNVNGSYCWYYFSEYSTCLRSVCWFLHMPRDGDEKFCMDTVKKFCHVGKHALILRAAKHNAPKML